MKDCTISYFACELIFFSCGA